MRITKYDHIGDCDKRDCMRNYCEGCRVLFMDCVTSYPDYEGDRETQIHRVYMVSHACPECGR